MSVRAKVTCDAIENNAVTFRTVYEGDAAKADTENARFTKATPWGEIKLGISTTRPRSRSSRRENSTTWISPRPRRDRPALSRDHVSGPDEDGAV